MQSFRELVVWQKAHELTLAIYRATRGFPKTELYGITSQLRRCASSVPANLAEGRSRTSGKDFARFVGIVLGSINETDYYLLLSRDLDYLLPAQHTELARQANEVRRMLISLHTTLSK
jgi:four helix bundle protein